MPALLVLAVAALGAGCSGDGSDAAGKPSNAPSTAATDGSTDSTDSEPLPGVRASVVQQRIDEGTRRIGIEVSTNHATSLHVVGYQLASPGFQTMPLTRGDTVFAPGQVIDLVTEYGRPRCGVDDPTRSLAAVLQVEDSNGGMSVHRVAVTGYGVALVRQLYARECGQQQLLRAASVSYTSFRRTRSNGDLVLSGAIELKRPADGGSGEPVTVDSLRGSVLLSLAPNGTAASARAVARLAPGVPRLLVPVQIGASGRCDQHGRSQSTQTFLLSVFVRVGSHPEHRDILVPPPPLQRQALALVDDVCRRLTGTDRRR